MSRVCKAVMSDDSYDSFGVEIPSSYVEQAIHEWRANERHTFLF